MKVQIYHVYTNFYKKIRNIYIGSFSITKLLQMIGFPCTYMYMYMIMCGSSDYKYDIRCWFSKTTFEISQLIMIYFNIPHRKLSIGIELSIKITTGNYIRSYIMYRLGEFLTYNTSFRTHHLLYIVLCELLLKSFRKCLVLTNVMHTSLFTVLIIWYEHCHTLLHVTWQDRCISVRRMYWKCWNSKLPL